MILGVPGKEPYSKRRIHGFVLGEGGVKMSKTLGNVINPDDLVSKYGADTARAYVMFMGPYDGTCEWSDRAVQGVYRFLGKFYEMIVDRWNNKVESSEQQVEVAINRLIKKVEEDIFALKFNTAIASCMEFVITIKISHLMQKYKETDTRYFSYCTFLSRGVVGFCWRKL
jgi:leucyl-tRNA synthetase